MQRQPEEEGLGRELTETVPPPTEAEARAEPRTAGGGRLPRAERIGRYVVLSHLGTGGMGTVYAAYDPDLDRKVALKFVRHDRTSSGEQEALLREARALARLAHPNVVRIYDVGLYGENVFFAMELVAGRNLRRWLRLRRPGWKSLASVFRQVASGLAAAHRAGLVHRDLKPSNILLDDDGKARIADFGLVRPVEERLAPRPTDGERGGDGAGTPGYVAPEVAAGGAADELSDQFSFGVALHHALHGGSPGSGGEPAGRGSGGSSGRRVPVRLQRILERTLSTEPASRYPSMSIVAAELGALAGRTRRRWAAAGLLALLVAAASPWIVPRTGGEPPCGGGEDRFAGIWDAERRLELKRAFQGSGSPVAGDAFALISRSLDRYRTDWLAAHHESCLATRVRGEQSERLLDLRTLCLERRREEARAVVDLLIAGSPEIVPSVARATESLSSIGDCADNAELALLSPPPADREVRDEIERLEGRLARQKVRARAGQKVDVDELGRIIAAAGGLGYGPLQARARTQLGLTQVRQEGDDAGVETLERALADAIGAGDRPSTAILYGRLAESYAFNLGDEERGRWWARFAEVSLAGLGPGQDEAIAIVRTSLGLTAFSRGESGQAHEHWRQALIRGERAWGQGSPRLVEILNNLGLSAPGPEDQMAFLVRALELKEETYGAWNPLLANTLVNLAGYLGRRGQFSEALPYVARASAVLERSHSAEHPDLAYPLILEGELLNALDRPREAVARLARVRILIADLSEGHPLKLYVEIDLAKSMLLERRLERAGQYLERASVLAAGLPPSSPLRLELATTRGRWLLLRGEHAAARTLLEHAAALEEAAARPPPLGDRVLLRIARGEALLGGGRAAAAQPLFEEAVELAGAIGELARLSARARLGLARSVAAADPERAAGLVRAAAADLPPGGGPDSRRLSEELAARQLEWVREEPPAR